MLEINIIEDYIYSVKVRQNNQGFLVGSKDTKIYIFDI